MTYNGEIGSKLKRKLMVPTIYTQENNLKVRLNGKVLINAMITRFDYFTYRAETKQEGKMKNI